MLDISGYLSLKFQGEHFPLILIQKLYALEVIEFQCTQIDQFIIPIHSSNKFISLHHGFVKQMHTA